MAEDSRKIAGPPVPADRRRLWMAAGLMLVIKLLVLVYTAEAYQIVSGKAVGGASGWQATLNHWDTEHYLRIAEDGYPATAPDNKVLAFFPLYPWTVRAVAFALPNYLISGLIVSGAASIAAAVLLLLLARMDLSAHLAYRSVWFLCIFPTSYFLHLAYSESLFIALTLASILTARKQRWIEAGVLGALAGFARINGILLAPVLISEAVAEYRKMRHFEWKWLWIAACPVGLAGYMLLNRVVAGSALAFMDLQRQYWQKRPAPPWLGIYHTFQSIWWRGPREAQLVGVQELLFVALGLICTVYCWRKLRAGYTIWMAGNWLLFTCTGFILSVPRYTLTMFPIFIIFAVLARNRILNAVITAWSLLFLGLFSMLFASGVWAF